MRRLVAACRLLLMCLHLLLGLLLASTFIFLTTSQRGRVTRLWSQLLLKLVGAGVAVQGTLPSSRLLQTGVDAGSGGSLLLINHVSWMDIHAVDAVLPSRFVAKAEIRRWPVIGLLVTLVGTLYIERGRRHAVHATNHGITRCLQAGEAVAVFPEGTTTEGDRLLPFHANLIAPALEVGAQIVPVALIYAEDGRPSQAAAFVGDMTIAHSIWKVLCARRLGVTVVFAQPIATQGKTRHQVAQQARAAIAAELERAWGRSVDGAALSEKNLSAGSSTSNSDKSAAQQNALAENSDNN